MRLNSEATPKSHGHTSGMVGSQHYPMQPYPNQPVGILVNRKSSQAAGGMSEYPQQQY